MIATPVQGDVDGIQKRAHYVFLKKANEKEVSHSRESS